MKRSIQWPVLFVVLISGMALGRWIEPSVVQGQFAPPVTNIPKEMTSYRDVVKAVLPAVVSVEPRGKRVPGQLNPNLGFGSGFVVDPSGVILTNWHVVEGADSVEITFNDGRKITSSDFKGDQNADIAVVRVKADGPLPALQFGDSSQMEVGDRVLAVGAPFGLAGSVTHGIISAKGRDLGQPRYDDFLQTDAAVNPGNSGGPLVNLAGQVIGVTSAIKSRNGGFQGIALAIAGNQTRNVMQQLLKNGVVKRGYLGITMSREVPAEVAARLGFKNGGIVIASVSENSPAFKAGLKADDAIIAIAGIPVRENKDLQRAVANQPLNQAVKLDIIREGKPMQLSLTIEEEPAGYGTTRRPVMRRGGVPIGEVVAVSKAGLDLTDLTPERAEAIGVELKSGALILKVEDGGPASIAGLTRGLVIVKVDKKDVTNAEQAKAALEAASPSEGALVQAVSAHGGTEYVIVKVQK